MTREQFATPPDSTAAPRRRMATIARLPWIAIAPLATLAVAHYVAGWGLLFDLAANVSYFAAVPLLFIAMAAALLRQSGAAVVGIILAFLAAVPLLQRLDWPQPEGPPGSSASVLFCNLEGNTAAWDRLRRIIDERKPELVALVEAGDAVVERITSDPAMVKAYPHRITPEPGLQWSQMVLSRHPLQLLKPAGDFNRYKFLYSFRRAAIIDLPQGKIIFTVEHPPSPRNQHAWNTGNDVIRLLGELVKDQLASTGLPMMIAGDFNTTPTGYRDGLLREATDLRGDPLGGLPRGTWPSSFPRYFRLPLDRVWASYAVVFTNREVLENVGSDHRPILVTFQLPASAKTQVSRRRLGHAVDR